MRSNYRIHFVALALLSWVSAPASAGIIGSTPAAAADYLQYKVVGTSLIPDNTVSLASVLVGTAAAPGGNVELFASSETLSNTQYNAYTGTTSLVGTIGGSQLTLSSLNASDWNTNVGGGQTLLQKWTADLFATYLPALNTPANRAAFDSVYFVPNGGLQRFSDPNISYAYSQSGQIHIGLAGLLNARDDLVSVMPPALAALLPSTVQLSELVKVNYNGVTSYLYGFQATASGLSTTDPTHSYTGNYDVTLADPLHSDAEFRILDVGTNNVPEPEEMLLVGLGLLGFGVSRVKKSAQ